ncbi:hypothetical protein [Halioxenophilus sp. WMMB6]|uniref:hypothetical protein n=1 Tax=Halioxenophilus sp. WMMB6 TaxID=3073815 RepID=UPI00295E5493|nr:hypothetical protein [Halioxenophilus sp. WMMB6]
MQIDWPALVFNPQWMKQLDVLAAKRFHHTGDAEAATTFVIEKLSEENWQRLATFSGSSRPETYLYTIVNNLLEEYSRKLYGRPRPPQWLKREGDLWVRIWKMLCLERQPVMAVIDSVCSRHRREPEFAQAIIKTIRGKVPDCGLKSQSLTINHTDSGAEEHFDDYILSDTRTLEQSLDVAEFEQRMQLFAEVLENLNSPSNTAMNAPTADSRSSTLLQVVGQLDLSEEELLIIRMVYQEGLKLNVVAKALNMPSYQPGRLLKRVFAQFIDALGSAGVPVADLQRQLQEVEI